MLAGWAIRDAIAELVRPHLRAMTISAWRAAWSRTALDMARAGVTPDAAVEAWQAYFQRTGCRIFKLAQLQERMMTDTQTPAEDVMVGVEIDFSHG
jgi:hypothetical protein